MWYTSMVIRGRVPGLFLLGFVAVAGVFVLVRPAQADPHAVFYTAIGQRQLFFNFLAALDQADYVEPALGNFSRQELVDKRETADKAGSVDEALKATKTDLAAVVSRLITLDGTDLWTNYVALQIAKEAAQATDTTAYIKLLCAQGLGRKFSGAEKFCENSAPVGAAILDQKRAFVVEPQERANLAYRNALSGLYSDRSSTSDYQEYLEYLQKPQTRNNDLAPDYPVPWDESVATLRKKTTGDTLKEQAVERLSGAATDLYRSEYVDTNVFDLIELTPSGQAQVRDRPEVTDGADKINLYMASVQGLIDLPQQFMNTAARGASAAQQHLAATETEGGLAPVRTEQSKSTACTGGSCPAPVAGAPSSTDLPSLGHNVFMVAPPYVNREQVSAGLVALGTANANPLGVPPIADKVPGIEQILPSVAGTQDDKRVGQVLHATSPSTADPFKPRAEGLDFSTNPTAAQEEQGPKHFLLALTDGSRDRSGCGCGINSVLNDLGQAILGKVNGWRL